MPKGNTYKTGTLDANLTENNTYLALFQTNPGPTGTGTEASYNGYARQLIIWQRNAAINGSLAEIKNTTLIEFGTVPSTLGSVAYAAIMTSATIGQGNVIYYGPLGATYNLTIGIKPTVPIGSLTVTES